MAKKIRCGHPNCKRMGMYVVKRPEDFDETEDTPYGMCSYHHNIYTRMLRNYFLDWKTQRTEEPSEDQSSDAA